MTAAEVFERRALEPIARALIRRLIVPKIYFGADWPGPDARVAVLAIDRAGSGDIHIVEVKQHYSDALKLLSRLRKIPAHYRWVAFQRPQSTVVADRPELYDSGSAGRIGLIEIVTMQDASLGANIRGPAERSHEKLFELADEFTGRTLPDIKFG